MEHRSFATAHAMMSAALAEASGGALVLTPTSRLAKRYRHARRMEAVAAGASCSWEPPQISSSARWVRDRYESLWEDRSPLPRAGQLHFWAEACRRVPPPEEFGEGIRPGPALYASLQQTYDLLCRKRAERAGHGEGLTGWRNRVIARFETLVHAAGHCGWDEALHAVRRAFEEGRLTPPQRLVVILQNEVEPSEDHFYTALARKGTALAFWSLTGEGASPACTVYATPEQECRAVCHEARLAWNASQGRDYLGIVALDPDYFPLLSRSLEDVSGRDLPLEGQTRFNFAWGTPLSDHPLFHMAVLPLRLSTAEPPAALLSSLLTSPLCNLRGRRIADTQLRSALWPEERLLDAEGALRAVESHARGLRQSFAPFLRGERKGLAQMVEHLRVAWAALGFPFFGEGLNSAVREAQANAWERLDRTLHELSRLAGDEKMEALELLEWLEVACGGLQVVAPGAESGGIQVLSLSESFGLPFDRLWAVGCHGGVLPAPRPAEPLLSPEEKLALGKKAHEEAWEQTGRSLAALRALGLNEHHTRFTRAHTQEGDGLYLSSPFLSDLVDGAERPFLFDIWKGARAAWGVAPWFAGTERGLKQPIPAAPPEALPVPEAIPTSLSISNLRTLLGCPFRYFAEGTLRLKPLPMPEEGLSPAQHGEFVHAILREFVERVEEHAPRWPGALDEAWGLLTEITDALSTEHLAFLTASERRAERRWLLGDDTSGRLGLLRAWLEKEQEHWKEGWRPAPAPPGEADGSKYLLEAEFHGVTLGACPITLRGKVDRVDTHPELGRWVMDYKTGVVRGTKKSVLTEFQEPQLPAYAAAVLQGRFGEGFPAPWEGPIRAGFVPLNNPSEVEIAPYESRGTSIDRDLVATWADVMKGRLSAFSGGHFPAVPFPGPQKTTRAGEPCLYCKMASLCGFYDDPDRALEDEASDGGEA